MGEAADDILEGLACECCGEWFHDGKEQGHPRSCVGCGGGLAHRRAKRRRKNQRKKARKKEAFAALVSGPLLAGWTKRDEYHYQRSVAGRLIDWWPSTGKYQVDGKVGKLASPDEMATVLLEVSGGHR